MQLADMQQETRSAPPSYRTKVSLNLTLKRMRESRFAVGARFSFVLRHTLTHSSYSSLAHTVIVNEPRAGLPCR
jgi:hypothetical protein